MTDDWSEDDARETPVKGGCVWCKNPVDDPVTLDTGEVICENCLGDLREFGRYRQTELFVTAGLEPALQRIILDHWQAIQADLVREYEGDPANLFPLPTRKSNANTYERQPDSPTSTDR